MEEARERRKSDRMAEINVRKREEGEHEEGNHTFDRGPQTHDISRRTDLTDLGILRVFAFYVATDRPNSCHCLCS
ncbi:hypothetical protein E2C01_045976 [Portunus trituberculatus]|uniref:Uncharacterized protein n=1 Tax=Portunus trituberculatus TaxID=210409 RepID=A0A5B7G3U2_PORTR|nr:hypothetical protein [Portunus trituberculatus]